MNPHGKKEYKLTYADARKVCCKFNRQNTSHVVDHAQKQKEYWYVTESETYLGRFGLCAKGKYMIVAPEQLCDIGLGGMCKDCPHFISDVGPGG